jgi:acyl transferase domain-containing protein
MTVAFLYPGEGTQHPGMAAALHATDRAVLDRHLRLAANVTGLPVRRFCLEGTAQQLGRPDVAEPALLALALALTEVARDEGLEPALVAGHGLGEYAAAVTAGALSADDAMRLVVLRSRLVGAARERGEATAVRAAMARRAERIEWRRARIPLASNAFGGLIREPEAIRAALVTQAGAPVGWHDSLHALLAGGATAFLELGPGGALARSARVLRGDLPAATAGSRAAIAEFVAVPAAAA